MDIWSDIVIAINFIVLIICFFILHKIKDQMTEAKERRELDEYMRKEKERREKIDQYVEIGRESGRHTEKNRQLAKEREEEKRIGGFANIYLLPHLVQFMKDNPEFNGLILEKPAYIDDLIYLKRKMSVPEFNYLKTQPMMVKHFGRDLEKYEFIKGII